MSHKPSSAVGCGAVLSLVLMTCLPVTAEPLHVNDGTSSDWQDNPMNRGLATITYISSSGLGSDATIECNAIATFPPVLPLYFQLNAPSAIERFHLEYVVELSAFVVLDTSDLAVNPLEGASETVVIKKMYAGRDTQGTYIDPVGTQTSIDGSSPPTIVFPAGLRRIYVQLTGEFTPASVEPSIKPVQVDPGLVIDVYGTRLAVPEPLALEHLLLGGGLLAFVATCRLRRSRPRA